MTMLYQHELRVRLSERRNRLYKAAGGTFENELALFLRWMDEQPYIRSLLTELATHPIALHEWETAGGAQRPAGVRFPDDESQRAKLCLEICRTLDVRKWAWTVSRERDFPSMNRDFVEVFVDPLVNFLHDRLEDGGSVLGILERYKRRTEWFHQRELHAAYTADTARGEAAIDAHLREYLVDQGIQYPFSQPRSPSGEVDIIAGLDGDDPLALEVKLFLPSASKGDAYIRQGFAQTIRYANDYGVSAGYLVAFNLTPELLVFEGEDENNHWPPAVRVGDTTAFLIAIQANPDRPSASKDRQLVRHVLTSSYLLGRED